MKHTLKQMRGIYQEWQQSGLSRKAFCKQHGIACATFNYWYKRFTSESASGFSKIPIKPGHETSFEIVFPSGARISFQSEPSVAWLRELVR
jgi:hypothetical protein